MVLNLGTDKLEKARISLDIWALQVQSPVLHCFMLYAFTGKTVIFLSNATPAGREWIS